VRHIDLYGRPGITYVIQVSTNLMPAAWEPLMEVTLPSAANVVTVDIGDRPEKKLFLRILEK
jgi:hypothetical protein